MNPLKDSINVFLNGAKENFKIFGYVTPIFAYFDKELHIAPLDFSSPSKKDEFLNFLIEEISKGKIREFLFISEAWMTETTNIQNVEKHLSNFGTLEKYPGRKESITVFYSNSQEEINYICEIKRNPDKLGEWDQHLTENKEIFTKERFKNIFQKAAAKNN
jgi:hypothetical protein